VVELGKTIHYPLSFISCFSPFTLDHSDTSYMTDNIELKPMGKSAPSIPPRHPESSSLHASFKAAEEKARAAVHLQEGNLDAVSIYGLAVSAW